MAPEAARKNEAHDNTGPTSGADTEDGVLRLRTEEDPAAHLSTVLVVDDDIFVCRAVACILREACRVQVYAARNGDEALRLAPEIRPDLVILDLKMPGTPAAEVCRALRDMPELKGTRICVLTGIMADPQVMQELRPHIDGVMTKPPDPRALVALVDVR
jgi:two-component system alkaline phosphatase synthesis response regulator PhoP